MEKEKIIGILKADRNSKYEIEQRIKNHTFTIFENFEDLKEVFPEIEEKDLYGGDFSITEYEGKTYYIAYEN